MFAEGLTFKVYDTLQEFKNKEREMKNIKIERKITKKKSFRIMQATDTENEMFDLQEKIPEFAHFKKTQFGECAYDDFKTAGHDFFTKK